jgi:hypothetical protein
MVGLLENELLNQVFIYINALHTEILIFCIAFVLHYAFFRKPMKPRKGTGKKVEDFPARPQHEEDTAPFSKDPLQVLERSQAAFDRGDHRAVLKCWSLGGLKSSGIVNASHLAQIVESMQRFKKDSESILDEVAAYLRNSPNSLSVPYINRLLEPLAKSLDTKVVEGISKLLPSLGLQADGLTFEILIRMRFTTRSFEEVSALVKQMETEGVAPTCRTTIMLLKTDLHTGNLDDALRHYRALATSAEGEPATPSEAPTHIAVQLVELLPPAPP